MFNIDRQYASFAFFQLGLGRPFNNQENDGKGGADDHCFRIVEKRKLSFKSTRARQKSYFFFPLRFSVVKTSFRFECFSRTIAGMRIIAARNLSSHLRPLSSDDIVYLFFWKFFKLHLTRFFTSNTLAAALCFL